MFTQICYKVRPRQTTSITFNSSDKEYIVISVWYLGDRISL